ncbi:short-chain alcohol dehydrogenase-like protein [Hahella chejuensis KCTC 2396]|uniref:Short-chain alcohol dehydrogenase-like protein n=1 Tax=Hahella chejuensis (strain KCTC 2396) TaxID=349521 RepID=Q2S7D6_HAHCH|nr:glucose 1-dehydrogenase [Hahella chejuensis]ABC33438.1 short-chain alcohol dehydrogenase-like protein [Hahella chejuensis KCTC 2396]
MAYDLQDKVILITGAASGIGKETALLLAQLGAEVVLSDINAEQGDAVATLIRDQGGRAHFCPADVTQAEQVANLHAFVMEVCGRLDCAVNSAGVEHVNARMADIDEATWDQVIDINLKGVFLCMREQIKCMLPRRDGRIINLASIAGLRSAPSLAPYSASKFGVVGLSKSAAVEYASSGIRINAVCPSFINTPMVQRALQAMDEKKALKVVRANPMQRLGEPEEIGRMIAWLCSDESSFMTGQAVALDGGLTA